jgi:predicted small secreted protein
MSRGVRQRQPGHGKTHAKEFVVHKKLMIALAMLSLLASVPFLTACHTTAGAGQDISKTGQAIEKGADKLTP